MKEIIVYFCGESKDECLDGLPFDFYDSARDYADDNGYNVYSVTCIVDEDTLELVNEA